jgi:Pregnancy-associated plasma protein-A
MNQQIRIVAVAVAALVAAAAYGQPLASAPPADTHFLTGKGEMQRGVRCATRPLDRETAARVDAQLRAFQQLKTPPGGEKEIAVAFHVVYSYTNHDGLEGYVDAAAIDDQIDVLNDAFADSGFSFYLASVDYTQKNNWFHSCWGAEKPMKRQLAIDPATTLNIYTCEPNGGILGFAYLPPDLPEDDYRHGVVALHSSLPGGTAAPYNEGDTITHEVGHYLGLDHTFEGGCGEPGDFVADTPAEASAAFGCPVGRDSCPADPGLDPILNFMDYTDDACMIEFTPDQGTRMQDMVALYKPSL